jgi:hypothetical protein
MNISKSGAVIDPSLHQPIRERQVTGLAQEETM